MRHLAVVVLLLGACGKSPRYSVQAKTITARNEASNVLLLVDASAAMAPHLTGVKASLRRVLEAHPGSLNFGLGVMGGDAACVPARVIPPIAQPGDDETLIRERTTAVAAALDSLTAGGSSSLAATLETLTGTMGSDRNRAVLLVTAGDPDCGGNASTATLGLRRAGIRTAVIGMGPVAAASMTLNRLAATGGFGATCPGGDGDCWLGDRCMNGVCARAHYPALDEPGLDRVTSALFAAPPPDHWCFYTLETQPAGPEQVSVLLDGVPLQRGPATWELEGSGIRFLGLTCTKLQRSTPREPVEVELRVELSP